MSDAMTAREFMLVHTLEAADACIVEAVAKAAREGADVATCIAVARRIRREQWATIRRHVDHRAEELDQAVRLLEAAQGEARAN